MRVSCNWLKDYVDIKFPPEKLAETLTMAGLAVESVTKKGADHILEVEVTSNRPDWLSMVGIAREVSAITGAKLKLPPILKVKDKQPRAGIKVKVEDKKLCARYTARVIRDVRILASGARLASKLEAVDLRPVNNVVDITNFCLFETGEPMHAFDLDKIENQEITVRRAHNGEKIVTIDGVERKLDNSMLIIADAKGPVAIAGVMGGLNTEVTFSTRNILLEAAYFDSVSVRRTSRKLALSTESSYRFERKVDISDIPGCSDRATGLISELAQGNVGEFFDVKSPIRKKNVIKLRFSRLNSIAGINIAPSSVKKILVSLGLKPKSSSGDKMTLEIPGFRHDLNSEVDVIEEILRVYGYNKIPVTLPPVAEQVQRIPRDIAVKKEICRVLTALGMDEVITYSLINRKLTDAALLQNDKIIEMQNPLTSEQEIMRPGLIPGMLGAISWNINRKTKNLKLFELGKVYHKEQTGALSEKNHLLLAMTGYRDEGWTGGSGSYGFFELKGAVETLLAELGISKISFNRSGHPAFSQAATASIEINGTAAGIIGRISRKVLDAFDIKEAVYACEIDAEALFEYAALEKVFNPLPKYPSVFRDISIVIDKDTSHTALTCAIADRAGALLKQIRLVDRYTGKQIPAGKVSLTYRLEYQSLERTLEDREVSEVHEGVVGELAEKFGATLRT